MCLSCVAVSVPNASIRPVVFTGAYFLGRAYMTSTLKNHATGLFSSEVLLWGVCGGGCCRCNLPEEQTVRRMSLYMHTHSLEHPCSASQNAVHTAVWSCLVQQSPPPIPQPCWVRIRILTRSCYYFRGLNIKIIQRTGSGLKHGLLGKLQNLFHRFLFLK